MSDSVRPHRLQPTRLHRPWDSPSKNTGVGCHFLLQCMKVKSESEVAQSCPTLSDPWTAAYQAPPSMGFSRQEYWSGVPLPSLRILLAWLYYNVQGMVRCKAYSQHNSGWYIDDIMYINIAIVSFYDSHKIFHGFLLPRVSIFFKKPYF